MLDKFKQIDVWGENHPIARALAVGAFLLAMAIPTISAIDNIPAEPNSITYSPDTKK
ncbi:MAG: hypothetical protein QG647_38 [Patescibacteria group bacterium]|nr:hypothetical protein [Patescibacteria group bacterium]